MNAQQPENVKSMFTEVAQGYDRANSVLSLGIHKLWRKQIVKWSDVRVGQHVLDCATGTGDLAIEFKKAVGPSGHVIGSDFCPAMLDFAPAKARTENLDIDFELADVMRLKYPSAQFDVCSIAFGIRNVQDPKKGIEELARVTKPGGRVMVLEFGQMQAPLISSLYEFYSTRVLPIIGGWITGRPEAYKYLQTSSANFPSGEAFLEIMRKTQAFSHVESRALMGGLVYMYKGVVKG